MKSPRRTYVWPIPKGITPHIQPISKRQLGTYQHNIPTTSPVTKKSKKQKTDDPKSEDKDNTTSGTAGVQVEDTTTNQDTTTPSGWTSLGAHVSETSQATSRPLHTLEEILAAHTIDDDFWDNTNPADVSVDMVNSEEQMAGSHITKFHTPEDKEIVLEDLFSQLGTVTD